MTVTVAQIDLDSHPFWRRDLESNISSSTSACIEGGTPTQLSCQVLDGHCVPILDGLQSIVPNSETWLRNIVEIDVFGQPVMGDVPRVSRFLERKTYPLLAGHGRLFAAGSSSSARRRCVPIGSLRQTQSSRRIGAALRPAGMAPWGEAATSSAMMIIPRTAPAINPTSSQITCLTSEALQRTAVVP